MTLSVLVLAAIGFAVSTQLRAVDAGRSGVEEAQLARAILARIADDLRSAVPYEPIDVSQMVPDTAPLPGAESDSSEASGNALSGESTLEELDAEQPQRTDDLAQSGPQSAPGLFGNSEQLQVDVSRLPRRDQIDWSLETEGQSPLSDRLSDVKTVVYYMNQQGTSALSVRQTAPALQQGTGLYRCELDRTVAAFTVQQGDQAALEESAEALAPEVTALEFYYFDGQQWLQEWDSIELGGLPMAVKIGIAITRRPASPRQEPTVVIYRLVVHLPTARPITQEGQDESY